MSLPQQDDHARPSIGWERLVALGIVAAVVIAVVMIRDGGGGAIIVSAFLALLVWMTTGQGRGNSEGDGAT